jgi:hypothetical protein
MLLCSELPPTKNIIEARPALELAVKRLPTDASWRAAWGDVAAAVQQALLEPA